MPKNPHAVALGRTGGQQKSPAKTAAARRNAAAARREYASRQYQPLIDAAVRAVLAVTPVLTQITQNAGAPHAAMAALDGALRDIGALPTARSMNDV